MRSSGDIPRPAPIDAAAMKDSPSATPQQPAGIQLIEKELHMLVYVSAMLRVSWKVLRGKRLKRVERK
jgi:hypothetical protein